MKPLPTSQLVEWRLKAGGLLMLLARLWLEDCVLVCGHRLKNVFEYAQFTLCGSFQRDNEIAYGSCVSSV